MACGCDCGDEESFRSSSSTALLSFCFLGKMEKNKETHSGVVVTVFGWFFGIKMSDISSQLTVLFCVVFFFKRADLEMKRHDRASKKGNTKVVLSLHILE